LGLLVVGVAGYIVTLVWSLGRLSWGQSRTLEGFGPLSLHIEEIPHSIANPDRNFRLILRDRTNGDRTVIFTSPDEGPPGTERASWSTNGGYVLVSGRNFFTRQELTMADGTTAYLLYEIATGRVWCNASQVSSLPPLTYDVLVQAGFCDDLPNGVRGQGTAGSENAGQGIRKGDCAKKLGKGD
jgi:hypothetical protein